MGQDTEWKILAEEAAQEKDPEKLMQIIQSLTRALDEKDANQNASTSKMQLKRGGRDVARFEHFVAGF
jgi:Mg-chelatase subunit ChlI